MSNVIDLAGKRPAQHIERCEAGEPDCGPVRHWDCDGVPLCDRCWNELEPESAIQGRMREAGLWVVEGGE